MQESLQYHNHHIHASFLLLRKVGDSLLTVFSFITHYSMLSTGSTPNAVLETTIITATFLTVAPCKILTIQAEKEVQEFMLRGPSFQFNLVWNCFVFHLKRHRTSRGLTCIS